MGWLGAQPEPPARCLRHGPSLAYAESAVRSPIVVMRCGTGTAADQTIVYFGASAPPELPELS